MSNQDSQAREMLKGAKLYCTEPRVSILKAMINKAKPLGQNQLAKLLSKNHFDKVTIYRTLECFLDTGLVHKAFLQKRAWFFELAHNCSKIQCHPHFTCTKCGSTECLIGASVPMVKGLKKGIVIYRQQTRLEGLCQKCNSVTN
jgi:Fur family ferric uptake transcriptional regulator